MIKAIFFDWFHTLAHFEPPRHQLYIQALREFGVELPPEKAIRGILVADEYFFAENAKSPVAERSSEEQAKVYIRYPNTLLAEAEANATKELSFKIMKRVREQFKGVTFALFDDVLSTLQALKRQNYILGLLTNLNSDMVSIFRELGIESYINFVVTAKEVGANKPNPPIFLAALEKAEVNASEAIHIGDQYKLDVIGARAVGINPILIDRYGTHPKASNYPRIHSLTELSQHL
ncbi:HAD family hydrolase [Chloroflexota bacterium]